MNRKQLESRAYVKPEMSVIQTIMEFPLLNGSTIKGGHKKPIINPETGDAKQDGLMKKKTYPRRKIK
ncbi:hypothetical protein [Hoylesella enoeca]|uniref:hypothetical protein n=1 Tax=Hoylesella enoeca TaxID=76123 RepID=UPI000B2EA317|nr:hypothetical protein [Hoylesella enoeca]